MRIPLVTAAFAALLPALARADDATGDPGPLPTALRLDADPQDPPPGQAQDAGQFSLGPAVGFLKTRGADDGTWMAGVQARLRLGRVIGLEGSITAHRSDFADDTVEIITYPVQVSLLVFPFPDSPVEPYLVGGVGWYYNRIEYDSSLGLDDETDHQFGVHLGAGLMIELSPHVQIFADFRWIFLDEPGVDNSDLEDEEFDTAQIMIGLSLVF
jgi:opacity protein-like surface antigen